MRGALILLVAFSLLLVACGDSGGTKAPSPTSDKAVKAAGIADEIASSPDDFESILEKHGMTVEQFEDLMYEISEDPVLSEAYAAARKVPDPE